MVHVLIGSHIVLVDERENQLINKIPEDGRQLFLTSCPEIGKVRKSFDLTTMMLDFAKINIELINMDCLYTDTPKPNVAVQINQIFYVKPLLIFFLYQLSNFFLFTVPTICNQAHVNSSPIFVCLFLRRCVLTKIKFSN